MVIWIRTARKQSLETEDLEPDQRTLTKVRVSDKPVSFLYDTRPQYKIITKKHTICFLTSPHNHKLGP